MVKNRFNTNYKDLVVNFRYGDVLAAEAIIKVRMKENSY
jgi:hypothetical protein